MDHHARMMKLALCEAEKAAEKGEVPVGAVLCSLDGQVLATAGNSTISMSDPCGHAEIRVIREAARDRGNYRLLNTVLYVTIEPCVMCIGAILHARITRLVFGAPDPKWGGSGSLYNIADDKRLNHQVEVVPGVCADEARALMQRFFQDLRAGQRKGESGVTP